jgi:heme exporter protein D
VSGFDSLASFLDMGGRAAYVWPAYGATLIVLVAMLLRAILRARASRRALARLEESGTRIRRRERRGP